MEDGAWLPLTEAGSWSRLAYIQFCSNFARVWNTIVFQPQDRLALYMGFEGSSLIGIEVWKFAQVRCLLVFSLLLAFWTGVKNPYQVRKIFEDFLVHLQVFPNVI